MAIPSTWAAKEIVKVMIKATLMSVPGHWPRSTLPIARNCSAARPVQCFDFGRAELEFRSLDETVELRRACGARNRSGEAGSGHQPRQRRRGGRAFMGLCYLIQRAQNAIALGREIPFHDP